MAKEEASELEAARVMVSRLFAAMAAGDSEAAGDFLHPEVVWTPISISGLGVLRNRRDAEGWVRQYGPGFGRVNVEVSRMLAVGGWIVVLGTIEDNRSMRTARPREAGWRLAVRDGLVVEAHASDTWDETIFAAERHTPRQPTGG